jgi:ribosomal-protein-alanine N-acetyltransferase
MRPLPLPAFPGLETRRCFLRPLEPEDASVIFALRSNPEVNLYLDRPAASSIEDAERSIGRITAGMDTSEWFYWGIVTKNHPGLIGTICLWNIQVEKSTAEIGYELLPEYQGKGYMSEVVATILGFGFNTLGLEAIEACLHKDNARSLKILEGYGFLRNSHAEEKLKEDPTAKELVIYILTK